MNKRWRVRKVPGPGVELWAVWRVYAGRLGRQPVAFRRSLVDAMRYIRLKETGE